MNPQAPHTNIKSHIRVPVAQLNSWGSIMCPSPLVKMELRSSHPRVSLQFNAKGEANCPYCGTEYEIEGGAAHHHG